MVLFVSNFGVAAGVQLKRAGVETVGQLLGQFMLLRSARMTGAEHCQAFYEWLTKNAPSITAHRSGIVLLMAEKTNTCVRACIRGCAHARPTCMNAGFRRVRCLLVARGGHTLRCCAPRFIPGTWRLEEFGK